MMVINDRDHNQCALLPINFAGDTIWLIFAGGTFFSNPCYSFPQLYLAASTAGKLSGLHHLLLASTSGCLSSLSLVSDVSDVSEQEKLIKRVFSSLKILMDIMDSKFVPNFVGMMVAKSI